MRDLFYLIARYRAIDCNASLTFVSLKGIFDKGLYSGRLIPYQQE